MRTTRTATTATRTATRAGLTAALAAGAAAALVLPAPSSAVAADDPDPRHGALERAEAAGADAEVLAKRYGWEQPAALAHLEESRRFAALSDELLRAYPSSFASARFAAAPGGTSLLRFVGTPPADVAERAKRAQVRAAVKGGAKYSQERLQERAQEVHRTLAASGYEQVVTATTTADGVLATVFGKGDPTLPRELSEGVRVTTVERPVGRLEHALGGARLLRNGANECTSGFTVVDGRGTTGVATAAHCVANQYRQPTDGLVFGLTLRAQHNGLWGDAEWSTSAHVEPAEFFATSTQVREVNSVSGLLPVGTPSCVYGRTSNLRACDRVYSNFVIWWDGFSTNFFLMAMETDNTRPGDSGGPWSFATEADGLHKGDLTIGGGRRNVWTRASLLPNAIGVSVRTQ